MPKAIEIYADQLTEELLLDADYPGNVRMFRFGWDTPSEIWEAMNDTVPSIVCERVRLVNSDGAPIMAVEDRTDVAFTNGLREFARVADCMNEAIASGFEKAESEIQEAIKLYAEGRPITPPEVLEGFRQSVGSRVLGWKG